jgi:hypothetical protein
VVLGGLALARQGDRTEKVAEASWPDAPVKKRRPGERLAAADLDM